MNRIEKRFKELNLKNKRAFIAYITAGDPTLSMTEKLVLVLERSGADIIELGIPFSDPLADGPTIQAASERALQREVNLRRVFKIVKLLRKTSEIPIAFMTYYNPVLKYGLEKFVRDCRRNGVDGVIVPDLPFEEATNLVRLCKRGDVACINLASPTSTLKRINNIARCSTGFIYYVSLTGVTGARERLPEEISSKVRLIKSVTNLPVAVGFGVSNEAQAKNVAKVSDGVIVGSAIVKIVEDNLKSSKKMISKVSNFSKSLANAIHSV